MDGDVSLGISMTEKVNNSVDLTRRKCLQLLAFPNAENGFISKLDHVDF